ncbi:ABC transporter ATP-binding protein [Bacteroides fragilis]
MVLNNLNLDIPENALYGYLGNNGSGKTTTIQVLLGLARPVKGEVLYDGQPFRDQREKQLRKIGLCPGEPFYYDNLTGYEHLAYLDHIYHCGRTAINKVLAITGIENARNKKLRHYSTGMIHRLGMAMALLHDPDILFLDEPLNGLDPEGIHSIRELLLQLHQEGKTVFLSSHLLDEVEKTCTHVGILQHGCLLYQGDLSELLNSIEKESISGWTRWICYIRYVKRSKLTAGSSRSQYWKLSFPMILPMTGLLSYWGRAVIIYLLFNLWRILWNRFI